MWDYQPHFRASAQVAAEQIFLSLDRDLTPQIQLIGLAICEDLPSSVVFEPDDGLLDREVFKEALPLARKMADLEESPEELHRRVSDHARHRMSSEEQGIHMLRGMVEEALRAQDERRDALAFAASPIRVGKYMVCVVLRFERAPYQIHAHGGVASDEFDVAHSLVDATIGEFLSASAKALTEQAPGSKPMVLGREKHEIVRAAATTLLYKRTYSLRKWGYPIDLFESCNAISSMKYEGNEGRGSMIISRLGDPSVDVIVELQTRVPLNDHRAARKLLEMATDHLNLLSDAGYIYGLGRLRDPQEAEVAQQREGGEDSVPEGGGEGFFRVEFVEHFEWELVAGDKTVMRVSYGKPSLLGKPIAEKRFRSDVNRLFGGLEGLDVERLWEASLAATKQRRGTMMLISACAEIEAARLRNQCIPVRPMLLTPHIVETVTAIDGALLADHRGMCLCHRRDPRWVGQ